MKTINTYYSSIEQLSKVIEENSISDSSKLLIQVFTSKNELPFISEITEFFSTYFPLCTLIGSTTDGEIKDGKVSTFTTVISFSIFDDIELKAFISNEFSSFYEVGYELASNIIQEDTKVIISFIDGLIGNGEEFLNGISSLNKEVIVSGGLAGDNAQFTQTLVFTKDAIYSNGVVGVSLSSPTLKAFTDYAFSWEPVGEKLKITKVDKNRVYTINNKTAVDTYAYYLGEEISEQLPNIGIEFPLIAQRDGVQVARAVIGRHDDGSLVFAGNLNENESVQFGYGNSKEILSQTQSYIDKLYNLPIESIFIYSCMARRRFMPDEIENETITYQQIAPTSGFYTNGEFFSCSGKGKELLNQSMTLLILSESDLCNNKKIRVESKNAASSTIQALSHLIHVAINELEQKDEIMITQSRNNAMGEILNMIAHQWRQPLNVISLNMNNILLGLELETLDKKTLRKHINNVLSQSSQLSETIDSFKDHFSFTQTKKEIIQMESLIKEAIEVIQISLDENEIAVEVNSKSDTEIINSKQELIQVFLTLINNSKDAFISNNIEKKFILVTIEENENFIVIHFCDNAGGIEEKNLANIFEPYFTTKGELNGAGLGLYISRVIIEKNMRGKIDIKNFKDGICVTIQIPK